MADLEKILVDIKTRRFLPVYFLAGEEPFFIDQISDALDAHVLDEMGREFNRSILYGKETTIDQVISECKAFPMMSDYRLVIFKEAQNLKNIENFEPYINNPNPSTVLVICYKYKSVDKRTSFWKSMSKNPKVFAFDAKKMYDNELLPWIKKQAKIQQLNLSETAAQYLAEFVGNDLETLSNQMEKLKIGLEPGAQVSHQMVLEKVGISKDFNVFELNKALAKKDFTRAVKIAEYFADDQKNHPLVVTVGTLYSFFSKILLVHYLVKKEKMNADTALSNAKVSYPAMQESKDALRNYSAGKVKNILHLIHEYDLKSKGVDSNADQGELLMELIMKIMLS